MNRKAQIKFLSYCIGLIEDIKPPTSFKELTEKDWSKILIKASQHSILPLLHYHLAQNKKGINPPTDVLERLKQSYLHNSLRNTKIYYELTKIINKANDNNIPTIVLKGAALAGSLYPSIALRPMADLDLFVKIEDIPKILDLLTQLGWINGHSDMTIEQQMQLMGHSLSYINIKSGLQIDLHFRVPDLYPLNLWDNTTSVTIGSIEMIVLKPEILLIFLCNHLYKHVCLVGLSQLIRFYDIVLVLRKYRESINWDYLIQCVYINQCENIIFHILEIINSEFGEDIPLSVLDKLKSTKYTKNTKYTVQIRKSLYKPPTRIFSGIIYRLNPIRKIVLPIRTISLHWMDPEKYTIGNIFKSLSKSIFKTIFPSKKFIIERYSPKRSWLFFVYYPAYHVTGVKNFFSILFNLIFKRKS